MTKKELIEQLQNVPDDAAIVIYADHGQNHEGVSCIEKFHMKHSTKFYDTDEDEWTECQFEDTDFEDLVALEDFSSTEYKDEDVTFVVLYGE